VTVCERHQRDRVVALVDPRGDFIAAALALREHGFAKG
jgi:hypothetical protein